MSNLSTCEMSAISNNEIEDHIKMIHQCAKGCNGKLVLCVFGEDPHTGKRIKPIVLHYEIGMTDKMFDDVMKYTQMKHHNVYMPLTVIDHSVRKNCKGTKGNIISVLGLCADFDDREAGMYQDRLPLPADLVIETSHGRFQCMFIFDKPSGQDQANEASALLQQHCGCDFGTKDISHVWRIPGTLNHPNKKKVSDGRVDTPQLVKAREEFGNTFTNVEKLIGSCDDNITTSIKQKDQSREDYRLAGEKIAKGFSDLEVARAIQDLRGHDEKSQRQDYIEKTIKAAHVGTPPSKKVPIKPAISTGHVLLPEGEYKWTCTGYELNNKFRGIEKLYLTGLIDTYTVKLMMNNSGAFSSKLFVSWVIAMQRLPDEGEELTGAAFLNKEFRVKVGTTVPEKVKGTPVEKIMKSSIVTEIIDLVL